MNVPLKSKKRPLPLPTIRRDIAIEQARRSFWQFCVVREGEFYKAGRAHLWELCHVLQALYEGRIIKFLPTQEWQIVSKKPEQPHSTCKRLMLNMPPRHGKSRTLVNFTAWVFGRNNNERVITCSYNDTEAQEFSRYTRDCISEERSDVDPNEIVYEDIFPGTKIKRGDGSYRKWSLEGQFFNYKGAGLLGSITGKGCSLSVIDDPVKGAEEAYNSTHLDKIWRWYTGTFLSRKEEGAIEIVNHTRWSQQDPCGRILAGEDAHAWYIYKKEAYDEENDTMLCDELLSKESYEFLKRNMDENIFYANYHQRPLDLVGRLYKSIKTYTDYPYAEDGTVLFEEIIAYTDTADQGDDYLCVIVAGVYQKELWVVDVLYTKEGMEVTEPATARLLAFSGVTRAWIESNNGGRGFARAVEREIKELEIIHGPDVINSKTINIKWFHQSNNKIARIHTASNYIQQHFYFPHNWSSRWPQFFKDVVGYQKEGKNKHDDAPDALTGLAEMINYRGSIGLIYGKAQSEEIHKEKSEKRVHELREQAPKPVQPGPLHPDTRRR